MTNTLTKLKEHFTAAELAAFNPEQLEIIIKSMIPSQEKVTTITSSSTLLQDDHQLEGPRNWLSFKHNFRNMLRDLKLWEEGEPKIKKEITEVETNTEASGVKKEEWFGRPKDTVGLYVLQKNIKHSVSSTRIQACHNGQAGWDALVNFYERQTLPSKLNSLQSIQKHSPGPNSNIRASFNHHEQLTSAMITTFGNMIKTRDLCDMIFLNSLKGYDFQTDYHKTQESLDFQKFQNDVETAFDGRDHHLKPQAKMTTVSDCPSCHSKNYMADGVCSRCNPCKKCTDQGLKYTWHVQNSPTCQKNTKQPLAKKNRH